MDDLFFIDISSHSSILNTHDNVVAIFFITDCHDFYSHYEIYDPIGQMSDTDPDMMYTFSCCDAIESFHYSYIPLSILKKYSYKNIDTSKQPVVILVSMNKKEHFTKFMSFLTKLKLQS